MIVCKTRNLSLAPEFEDFVGITVASGRCRSASEIFSAALRHERERRAARRMERTADAARPDC